MKRIYVNTDLKDKYLNWNGNNRWYNVKGGEYAYGPGDQECCFQPNNIMGFPVCPEGMVSGEEGFTGTSLSPNGGYNTYTNAGVNCDTGSPLGPDVNGGITELEQDDMDLKGQDQVQQTIWDTNTDCSYFLSNFASISAAQDYGQQIGLTDACAAINNAAPGWQQIYNSWTDFNGNDMTPYCPCLVQNFSLPQEEEEVNYSECVNCNTGEQFTLQQPGSCAAWSTATMPLVNPGESCPTVGCMTPNACNYDPNANVAGGCTYPNGCGSCTGDTSCFGCDGVANSGVVNDSCGVCGGDNSSCAGCDGVPNSGVVNDACGVCGGDGTSCQGCTDPTASNYNPAATLECDGQSGFSGYSNFSSNKKLWF